MAMGVRVLYGRGELEIVYNMLHEGMTIKCGHGKTNTYQNETKSKDKKTLIEIVCALH